MGIVNKPFNITIASVLKYKLDTVTFRTMEGQFAKMSLQKSYHNSNKIMLEKFSSLSQGPILNYYDTVQMYPWKGVNNLVMYETNTVTVNPGNLMSGWDVRTVDIQAEVGRQKYLVVDQVEKMNCGWENGLLNDNGKVTTVVETQDNLRKSCVLGDVDRDLQAKPCNSTLLYDWSPSAA